ncbi:MAG: hypothetical protein IPM79_19340 [Polyangiaceae bacterium]|jgi:hypothetical protein|nr:hypothetical protein [Polyangiaceae bacterium]
MSRGTWAVWLLLTAGCGANVVFGEGGDGAAGGGGAADDGSFGAGPSSGGGGDAPTGIVTAEIVEAKLGADCMPEVGPDPIQGSVLVSYTNLGSTAGALELERAEVLFASQVEAWVFPIALSPTSSGVIAGGTSAQLEHTKVATDGDSSFVCSLCGLPGTVSITWRAGNGTQVTDQLELTLLCAL